MKILKQLDNVEKAKLLHAWFPDEMGGFLETMKGMCEEMLNNEAQLRANPQDGIFSIDLWLSLAKNAIELLKKYNNHLHKSNRVFSDHLFDGYQAMLSAHCLIAYAKTRQLENRKFYLATDLLFDI